MEIQENFFTADRIIWGDQECLRLSCLGLVELLDLFSLLEIAYLAICVTVLMERMAQHVLSVPRSIFGVSNEELRNGRISGKMAELQFYSSPSEVGKHNGK